MTFDPPLENPPPTTLNDLDSDHPAELRAVDLECIRGDRLLFSALSFDVQPGQMLLIEGANGAGKTSLLRILAGLSRPSEGEVRWCGHGITDRRTEYCARMIYLGHATGLKAELSPLENLRLWLTLMGFRSHHAAVRQALTKVGLGGYEEAPTRVLSAGQRQRTALARLLLSPTTLWILDEPFTALDAEGLSLVRGLLENHAARGGMACLTSHQPMEISGNLCRLLLG